MPKRPLIGSHGLLYLKLVVNLVSNTVITWLQAMYKSSKAQARVIGTLSDSFELQQGTRQGDPLSPLIFEICI